MTDSDPQQQPCPGIPVTGVPPQWPATPVTFGVAIPCPLCRQSVVQWRFPGDGTMRHGDPGE